ncbi:DUF167 domain-containing protein [Candidatus Kaiserbacteria bacterium]|nr:DUF167 domain-containing protein [Candidatus Kaiserbacteria bacterium]
MEEKLVRVRVTAGAKREQVEQHMDGSFTITVKERAEANAANTRIRTIVSERLGVPLQSVQIQSGQQKGSKLVRIRT